jgi:large subunit ribosomal protein L22
MEARAIARFVRVSPTKADRVLRQIRGLQVERAQEILAYSPRPIAKQISKVLTSAVANATHREEPATIDLLYVKHAVADSGPTLKRIQPRAQGRAYRVLVRLSHITIVVDERGAVAAEGKAAPAAKPEAKGEAKPAKRAAKAKPEAAGKKAEAKKAEAKKSEAAKGGAKRGEAKAAPKRRTGTTRKTGEKKK